MVLIFICFHLIIFRYGRSIDPKNRSTTHPNPYTETRVTIRVRSSIMLNLGPGALTMEVRPYLESLTLKNGLECGN